MKQDRTSLVGQEPSSARTRMISPAGLQLSLAPALWSPRFAAPTPMQHLPLLFWLVSALRPERAAVIGLGEGAEFFSLCQALDRGGDLARCMGFAVAPDAEDGAVIPAPVARHAAEFYPDIASLTVLRGEGAAGKLPKSASIDLLLISGAGVPTTADGALGSPAEWTDLLAPDGVLILHDRSRLQGLGAEWQGLINHPDAITFEPGQGVVIIPQGEGLPAALTPLADSVRGGVIAGETGLLLERLGQALQDRADHSRLRDKAATDRAAVIAAGKGEVRISRQLSGLREAHAMRGMRLGRLQAQLFQANREQAEMAARLKTAEQMRDDACAAAEADQARAESERNSRFHETAALAQELETMRKQHADTLAQLQKAEVAGKAKASAAAPPAAKPAPQAEAALKAARQANDHLRAEMATLRAEEGRLQLEITALEQRVDDLLASTSWRITAPMRGFRNLFRRS